MNQILISLNLTKAYYVLNHKVLLSNLNSYGIGGVANLWLECYLSHQKQCVEINSVQQGIYMYRLQGKLIMVCHRVRFLVHYYFHYT